MAFLDATSAFDTVQHPALTAAFAAIGAAPSFVRWIKFIVTGHRRVIRTAYSMGDQASEFALESGTPQAAPSTLAFHAVWPVLTFVFGLVNQWDEDASMTMVRLGSRGSRVCGCACPYRLSLPDVRADGRRSSQRGRGVSVLDRRV